jgi:adenosylmethionine-8-amino-7-oxononanoate aminotransferase
VDLRPLPSAEEENMVLHDEDLEQALQASDLAHVVHPLARPQRLAQQGPVVVVSGNGAEVTLSDGRTMIDVPAAMWCVNVGHGRRELIDAAVKQMETIEFSPLFGGMSTPATIALAEKLAELAPGDLNHVFFVNGGSEANETALKFARYYWYIQGRPEKTTILAHDRGYHGVMGLTTYATGLQDYHTGYGPAPANIQHFPSPYEYRNTPEEFDEIVSGRALQRRIDEIGADKIAAIIAEPVLGSGGVLVPPVGYQRRLREICDENDILLIADEIITGFGRTGTWFASERDGVVPDFLTMAKGISSGYIPLGGALMRSKIWNVIRDADGDPNLWHGFTTSGHPVACAVALANIDVIEKENLIEAARERGEQLGRLLEELKDLPEVGDVRRLGLMAAIELVADQETKEPFPPELERAQKVMRAARDHGILIRTLIGNMLFLAPPFVITEDQITHIANALRAAIIETRENL